MKKYQAIYLMLFFLLLQSAYGNWQYRRTISIAPADTILTDYQILLTLTPGNFDYTHSVGDSGQDLRFSADSTGNAAPDIHYWIEEWNENDTSKVWIKVPSVSSVDTTVVFMYHGNSTATSVSNGDSTFIFFDDFEDGIIDSPWVEVEYIGSITENNGYLETSECGQYGGQYCVDGYAYVYLDLLQAVPGFELTEPFRIRVVTWNFEDSYHQGGEVANTALWNQVPNHNWPIDAVFFRHADPSNQVGHYQGYNGGTFLGNYALMEDRWFIEEFRFDGSQMELWFDGISKDTISNWGPVEAYIALGNTRDSQENIDNNKWDNLAIAKYTALEPSVAVSTTEETGSWSLVTVDTSLVAYYPFNGNANDESGNGNDGTVHGATLTIDRFGNDSSAYQLDGNNDYIEVFHDPSLNITTGELTVVAWGYLNAYRNDGAVVTKGLTGSTYSLKQSGSAMTDSTFQLYINPHYSSDAQYVTSNPHLPLGEWFHLAAVIDTSTVKLYFNGNLDEEETITFSAIENNTQNLYIGVDFPAADEYWNGKLDEIYIYNRALTSQEIDSLYHLDGWDQNIALSIPNIVGMQNDTVLIPLNVQFPIDSLFISAEITIGGYEGQLEFLGLDTTNSLVGLAGWTIQYNETDSLVITASAGANNISGSGTLFSLRFVVPDTAVGFIPITLESATFDTGTIPVTLTSGGVNVLSLVYGDVDLNGLIQAYDAALILKHLVGYITLDTQQMLNANVSSDTTVSALDATFILQYVVSLIDSLPWDTSNGLLVASGMVGMEDGFLVPGSVLSIPLTVQDLEGVLSFEFRMDFNSDDLEFISIDWMELMNGYTIETKVEDGLIKTAGAGSALSTANDVLGIVQFQVKEGFVGEETEVVLSRLRWNEGMVQTDVAVALFSRVLASEDEESLIPLEFGLGQNYPNPFNPVTTIAYQLPEASPVNLSIYNLRGELVETLVNIQQPAGYYKVQWDAGKYASGIYFYMMQTPGFKQTKKGLVIK